MKAEAKAAERGARVTLHYRLSTPEGGEIATTFGAEPLAFVLGSGELAPVLERCLLGMAAGARRQFRLAPEQAFGPADPALVQTLRRADFPEGVPEPGALIEFSYPDGRIVTGRISAAGAESVTVDFNHPLCGLALVFEAEIVSIETLPAVG